MPRVAFVVGGYPSEERRRREEVALSYATAEVQVGIVDVAATPYIHGLTPAELHLAAPPFVDAFRRAEQEGYDAVVPLGTLDLGVDAGRSVVDIPVIAPTEAMLHIACFLGVRFGLIVYHEKLLPLGYRLVERYGMSAKVAGWECSGFDLPDVAANRNAFIDSFVDRARHLVEKRGADVILPLGITQCPVHVNPNWLAEQLGVPVVEGIGAPIRLAAMFAGLGLRHSRRYWPKSASFG